MRRPLLFVFVLAVVGAGAWVVRGWLWPDETARVRAAVEALAASVTALGSARPGPDQFGALADLRSLLDEQVTIEAARRAVVVEGRDQVLGLAAQLSSSSTRPSLSFVDVSVSLTADNTSAVVGATAQVVETGAGGTQALDAQQVELVWTRQGQSWLLRSASVIDVLR